jgi:hypothetical protein
MYDSRMLAPEYAPIVVFTRSVADSCTPAEATTPVAAG